MKYKQEFVDQIDRLGVDTDAFFKALSEEPKKAYYLNTTLISNSKWREIMFPSTPFTNKEGSYYYSDTKIGLSLPFILGLIYAQEPSAQMVCSYLPNLESKLVLDVCASPGGKSCMLAGKCGTLISNEYVSKRVNVLRSNIERMGYTNTIITNKSSEALARELEGLCYLTLVDAPCSGEGMFRKDPDTISEWSLSNVYACASRQKEILDNASRTVTPGGYLIYSTCTYSLEENEMVVADFLSRHTDFSLIPLDDRVNSISRDGIDIDNTPTHLTRRFYPMDNFGEGQYLAIMKKSGTYTEQNALSGQDKSTKLSSKEDKLVRDFITQNTTLDDYILYKLGTNIFLYSGSLPPLKPDGIVSLGVCVGSIEKDRFVPHHNLARSYGKHFKNILNMTSSDIRIGKYIRGEQIEDNSIKNGYCVIQVDDYNLGLGKCNNGRINNLYPKGLRIVI